MIATSLSTGAIRFFQIFFPLLILTSIPFFADEPTPTGNTATGPATEPAPNHSFPSWKEVFNGPVSVNFGVKADGSPRNSFSLYRWQTPDQSQFTLDTSNNRLLCSLRPDGLLHTACILEKLSENYQENEYWRGIPVSKDLLYGGPWTLNLEIDGKPPVALPKLPGVESNLLCSFLPLIHYPAQNPEMSMLAFAPEDSSSTDLPKAVIVVLRLQNSGSNTVQGNISLVGSTPKTQDEKEDKSRGFNPPQPAQAAVISLDQAAGDPNSLRVPFSVAPGSETVLSFAVVLGVDTSDVDKSTTLLRSHPALDWLNKTLDFHTSRLGELLIPGDSYYAETFLRATELCRQCSLYDKNGDFGGGFNGSNFLHPMFYRQPPTWVKDLWNTMIPMAQFDPQLCVDSIPFFLDHALPPKAFGRGLQRFPNAPNVTHSLSLAVAPFNLAGFYYQATGDKDYFLKHPELLAAAKNRFNMILSTQLDKNVFLFPSMYISDGDARGNYHTGSNVTLWHAFHSMARLAREVYRDTPTADQWDQLADKIKKDLLAHCLGDGPTGTQFFEGANRDGSFVTHMHDGEESDCALMSVYGLCDSDFPPMIRHAAAGMSPYNKLYNAKLDAVRWQDGGGVGTDTFPAWTTAIAGAANETELRARLERIAHITDLDGSFWWHPYLADSKDIQDVRRLEIYKCGWAAASYVDQFLHTILGLEVDVPKQHLTFRPFSPFDSFQWTGCHLGTSLFDISYKRSDTQLTARVTNRNSTAYATTIELLLPSGANLQECRLNGAPTTSFTTRQRYGRPSIEIEQKLEPTKAVTVEMKFNR